MDIIRVSYLQLLKQESIIFLNNVIMIFLIDIMFCREVVFLLSVLKYSGSISLHCVRKLCNIKSLSFINFSGVTKIFKLIISLLTIIRCLIFSIPVVFIWFYKILSNSSLILVYSLQFPTSNFSFKFDLKRQEISFQKNT